ncbi:efflux RND transporter permease subunit [Kordiimonas sp. SCSIO 12603]|uniref:efflux RND transporter permease subunit n=1 Tax=Kordiimonas sp. SCSIO 12603 TaxID=2829596 RepID=UPI0021042312|nr:efflux RND transporter permease subunit [Kordiimonas sp. SCSIO 12603]UTW58304.1 efflux RND transporter permease subunit [Kordiimonas sp. SCSIO 12603]
MPFTDLFIKKPALAIVVNIMILMAGIIAVMKLPIRQYPEIEAATISVTTAYPGATPELMQGFVTTPIAQSIATATGVEYLSSETVQGMSTISARLKLNADSNQAMTEIMAKINEVRFRIPSEATDPVIRKTAGQGTAIMYVGFSSETLTIPQVTDYLNRAILPRLASIEGVGSTELIGAQELSIRLWLDPRKMAALDLTASDVSSALRENNVQAAPGNIEGSYITTNLKADTDIVSISDFENMVLRNDGNNLIRVRDVATVEFGAKSDDQTGYENGVPVVFVGVNASPTGNPLTIVEDTKALFEDMKQDFPPGLTSNVSYDVTRFINASIDQVTSTLIEAVGIVIIVMYLFLGSFRTILVPIVTIPLSLVGAAAIMTMFGFSINLLTLLAMVLAIGLVVDDAIVVVENVFRHMEKGESPLQASLKGAREIVRPVIAMTATLAIVYAPIGFVGGLTGSLFREFAFALAAAVVISGVVALTLSPMMAAYTIDAKTTEGKFTKAIERFFGKLTNLYQGLLSWTLKFRYFTVLFALVVMSGTAYMYMSSAQELAPEEDQGNVFLFMRGPQNANIDYTNKFALKLEEILRSTPEYDQTFIVNGPTTNEGFGGVVLKRWENRDRSQQEVQQEVQGRVMDVEGLAVFAFPEPALPGSTGGMPVQMIISSSKSPKDVFDTVENLKMAANQSGLFMVTDSNLNLNTPVTRVKIDRNRANALGIRMADISDTLAIFVNENYVNRINVDGRAYEVIPQVSPEFRLTPDTINQYYVRTGSGTQVPLSSVITLEEDVEPNKLFQFNQLNSATFQGIPAPGVTMDAVVEFLENYAATSFPSGFSYDWQGDVRQFVYEGNQLATAFALAMLVIYLALVAQFNSFRDPFIILVSVPLSLFGALLPIYLGYTTINIYTQIGLVTLIGLISKHGILMVEFANQLQQSDGLNRRQAILKASAIRLRPILMTTAAMVVGLIPLATSTGAGAASRFALGIVIVVGMLVGTFFTLFILPAVYSLLAAHHNKQEKHEDREIPEPKLTVAAE